MTHVTCRLTATNRDQLRNSTLGDRVWTTFTFLSRTLTFNRTRPRPTFHTGVGLCASQERTRVDRSTCACVCVFGASRYFVCRRLCPSRRRRQTLAINHVAARHARDDRPANTADKFDSRILKSARFATAVVYTG